MNLPAKIKIFPKDVIFEKKWGSVRRANMIIYIFCKRLLNFEDISCRNITFYHLITILKFLREIFFYIFAYEENLKCTGKFFTLQKNKKSV